MRLRSTLFYVAVEESGGEIAGVAGLELNEIRLLFVAPGRQREGIGSALLEHLESMVPQAVFREIFLYASPGAAGFYESQGYNSRGRHNFENHEIILPTIFMSKMLCQTN